MKHAVLFFLLISLPAVVAQQPAPKKNTSIKPKAKATAGTTKPKATTSAKKSNTSTSSTKSKTTAGSKVIASSSKPKPKVVTPKRTTVVAAKPKPTPTPLSEKEQFEKASAFELAADRVPALEKFLEAFPQAENHAAAVELLASSRVLIAEEKLLSGDTADAVAIYRIVVDQLPQPIPDDLFNDSIAKIPSGLFFHGQRAAAIELAAAIESKIESDAARLLEIANFHLATENGSEAMRVAAKAAAKDPSSAAVQRTIALAHRINFDLDLSADAYAKSLELEPGSAESKRGLAEMKRALGRSDEAVALYRELLAKNENDLPSRTGMILSLFDAGKQTEAEAEMAKSLQQTPGNVILLAGAAYWYASKGLGDKAVELAEKGVAREPRYIWSHIALARGLMSQKKPVEAEQVLVRARAYGNFPTLEYEIASARMAAGFFREAVEDLQKQFIVTDSGTIKTNLGGRVQREEKSLTDLVGFERKASIFTPIAADSRATADSLKALLILDHKLQAAQPDDAEIGTAADAFVAGTDKMKLHRQIHAASMLLQKHVALAKVIEFAKAATGNTDASLEVPNPRAAVMASELYEARAAAFRRNEFLVVPDAPTQTLSAILRGRIEEIIGWALYQQNNFPDAIIRLRRSISVMPDKSAWWRASMWRLGAALAADGKDADALNAYIESYKTDKPDFAKYAVVEALYKKVNGNTDGLEAKIGTERVAVNPNIQEIKPSSTPVETTIATEVPAVSGSPTPAVSESPTDQPKTSSGENPKVETPASDKPVDPKPEGTIKTETPVTESSPKPTAVEVVPTDASKPPPEQIVPDVKSEPVSQQQKVEKPKDGATSSNAGDQSSAVQKPLFDPIIITVPNNRPAKTAVAATKTDGKEPADDKSKSTDPEKKAVDSVAVSGGARPRLIDGQEVKLDDVPPCKVGVSQESVSLINGGGSVGILVSVDPPGDIRTLTAISNSPKDIELMLEPEISGVSDRRFYVIKSISNALGVYQVTFATPCGTKDMIVTVR